MTTIHLFRHGQTEANLEGRIQGHLDAPLTELGIQQAIDARSKISGIEFDVVITSPSGRAVHTADLLMNGSLTQMKTHTGLMEINLGSWEGKTFEEVAQLNPKQHHNIWHQPSQFVCEGAETFAQVAERGLAALNEIVGEHPNQTILMVSHAAWIKTIINDLLGRDRDEIWQDPYANNLCHSELHWVDGSRFMVKKFCDQPLK
ncbi:histidine phosphatase family protein [Vibrio sp. SCSIO 43136]|uniref:histidine phosphatase family protein n=1 Tax=Vibrio sp. SCSIO 43136 TaxID=2819101 RepID=UPI0020760DDE|nr:histidine phosphatase family protein [Vibrio sp. SCSIO 43136]USD68020.1 histidine phosphatase family protein [Vibrio sp. SCSIO 43136]